ncbi:hypothetical protein D3Z36_10485 [Lachnospiraceae bacterium]|nr:hypothetical protein [Lachnospiraceae bacterium]
MEQNKGRSTRILEWEELQKKNRSPKEELLMQSVYRLEPAYWVGVKLLEECLYGAFCFHRGADVKRRVASAAFLLDEQEFLLVILKDENDVLHRLSGGSGEGAEMEEKLETVFEGLLKQAKQKVEEMEKYLIDMEQEIVGGRISRNRNRSIFECKRLLTVWKNDYMQFLNMIEGINGLEEKKKDTSKKILNEEAACYFRIYENKLRHLTEENQFLYEELVHIREALDAALSYEQNRIMKLFTTVTTIFMPLSLIAGWYGMNFEGMPELHWRYGYGFVSALSVLVVLACFWFFRKKKLF